MPAIIPAVVAWAGSTAFTVATVAVTYGTLVEAAFVIGSIAYSAAQNRKLRNSLANMNQDQGRDIMSRDPLAYRRLVYGQVRLSGTIVYMATTGTKNENLHVVVALAGRECAELGDITFDDGEAVPLDGSGNATGKYAGFFTCKKFVGTTTQAASPELIAAFPGVWTSAHNLFGIAYLHCVYKYSSDLYPNALPTTSCLVKGCRVFDPRDGSQSSGTPSTWLYSNNSALCVADYLADVDFGRGIAWARIRSPDLIEAANICDEDVVLADATTEKRYATDGTITSDQLADSVIGELCGAMAGAAVDTGGLWTIRAGAYRTPTVTLTDDDSVGTFTMTPRQSRADTFNGVKGTYISPINQWAASDFPAIKNDTYMGWDGGIRLWKDISLNFTTSPARAQRLAKIDLEVGRQQIMVEETFRLTAFECMPIDTVMRTRAEMGWSAKEFKVTNWKFTVVQTADGPAPAIKLNMQETAAAVYDWADGEETTVDLAPNTNLPDPAVVGTPGGFDVLADSLTNWFQTDGTFVPRAKCFWNTANNIYVEQGGKYRLEYKKHADSTWLLWVEGRGDILLDYVLDVQAGVSYDFRVQFQNSIGVRGAYATKTNYAITGDVAAPATPTGLSATVGTGKLVQLKWTANTEVDLLEYRVYRGPSSSFGAASLIATVSANHFVDADVTLGTTYWYFIIAVDASDNASGATAGVSAVPSTSGTVVLTPPADPSAAALTGSGVYPAGDGTQFSYLQLSVPTGGADAAGCNLLYKRSGDAQWLIGGQFTGNSGTITGVRLPDLTPGVSYDIGTEVFSNAGIFSNVVVATSSPFTAPNKTSGPAGPTSVVAYAPGEAGRTVPPNYSASAQQWLGSRIEFDPSPDADVAFYEFGVGTGPTFPPSSADIGAVTKAPVFFYTTVIAPQYLFSRAVDRSGNRGAWVYSGYNLLLHIGFAAGNMSEQDEAAAHTSGLKMGASSPQININSPPNLIVGPLAGGSNTEVFMMSLSGYGFSHKPDNCQGGPTSNDTNVMWAYDWDNPSNNSGQMAIVLITNDLSPLPAGGIYRITPTIKQTT